MSKTQQSVSEFRDECEQRVVMACRTILATADASTSHETLDWAVDMLGRILQRREKEADAS